MRARSGEVHCLIACQGTAQLAAALVAARIQAAPGRTFSLIVHDLHSPSDESAFVAVLERLAWSTGRCTDIVHISSSEASRLQAIFVTRGNLAASAALVALPSPEDIDELYLGQNSVLLNELLRIRYKGSLKCCYGDGLGVNFTHAYFSSEQGRAVTQRGVEGRMRRIKSLFGQLLLRLRRAGKVMSDPGFDVYRLLMPNLFDEELRGYEQLPAEEFRQLFDAWKALQSSDQRARHSRLREKVTASSDVLVFLSTNFSESGKMTLADELSAYQGFIDTLKVGEYPLLVIKPHPRDSREKLAKLQAKLAGRFAQIVVLDDLDSFHLPFEVIYADCFSASAAGPAPRVHIVSFSTACLSLEYLYRAHCEVGFGDALVRQYVAPEWTKHRLRHEQDLRNALAFMRIDAIEQRQAGAEDFNRYDPV